MDKKYDVVVVETFGFGDCVYAGAIARWISMQNRVASVTVVCAEKTSLIPWGEFWGVRHIGAKVPWVRPGWWKSLSAWVNYVQLFRLPGLPPRQGDARLFLYPRGGLVQSAVCCFVRGERRHWRIRANGFRALISGGVANPVLAERLSFCRELAAEFGWRFDEKEVWPCLGVDLKIEPTHVVMCPEASLQSKYWDSQCWIRLIGVIRGMRPDLKIFVVHQKGDSCVVHPDVAEWRGDISGLANLLKHAAVVIATDSFAGHLASAAGAPVISLFGTDFARMWAPPLSIAITTHDYSRGMAGISELEVADAVRRVLFPSVSGLSKSNKY